MNLSSNFYSPHLPAKTFLFLSLVVAGHTLARAQSPSPMPAQAPIQAPTLTPSAAQQPTVAAETDQPQSAEDAVSLAENEAAQKKLARARALAAIGKLAASATELESLRASSKDESVRDVARILLMAVLIEMPDYTRAAALLGEAYSARPQGKTADAATQSYYALAGQTINAVRTHLERYRSFGVNIADTSELPSEANGDLEQLRTLLERVVEQAKALHLEQLKGGEKQGRGLDAAALLEDAATVRMRIARHEQDRGIWQAEVSDARQHLFSSEMRIASISNIPATRPASAPAQAASTNSAPPTVMNKPSQQGVSQKSAGADKNAKANTQMAQSAKQPDATTSTPNASSGNAKKGDSLPVAVGSLVGKARTRVSPNYPATARASRVSGVVTVFLLVNEKGDVESVQRADGPPQLQQAASEAARRWRFNPTVIDGQPMRVSGYLSFNFTGQN